MLKDYFNNILKNYKAGDATEASFYIVLQKFIENFSYAKNINLTITSQPKKTESGIPDFVIRKNKELIGYIEAKDIGRDLEFFENTEQIKKYKNDFDNFILTNYFDFWLFRRKEKKWVMKVSVSNGAIVCLKAQQTPPIANENDLENLLSAFLNFNIPERKTAKTLAKDLANKARLIPSYIVEELNNEASTEIDRIYEAFKTFLINDLTKADFADIYAQTIAYGLFMARLLHKGNGFNRFLAQQYLPKSISVLRDTFSLISGPNLPNSLNWIVDDIATILAYCDIESIKKQLKERTGGDDPLMHFYETFLKEYNPAEKKHRGVFYTPLPVVSFITRSVNILLKEKFNKSLGFANESVVILDPASGTSTFTAKAIEIAKNEIDQSAKAGAWLGVVKNHILKNYYAFELLMAPYIIGHLKISLLLEELGYQMQDDDRFNLFLTNTLDLSEIQQSNLPFTAGLSEEAAKAKEVKQKIPVLAIMGNPPYAGTSYNKGTWILEKIDDYKQIAGNSLNERNPKWLQDDYVKFIKFGQWKIGQVGKGILGFITNHAWIDNPTFRGMRFSLLQTFDEVYILNLHGNYKRKEKTPQGEKDENVFDIQQGVSIVLMVKLNENVQKAKIKYYDIWGKREEKYEFLENHNIKNTDWQTISPIKPYYFFAVRNNGGQKEYENFYNIADIFSLNSVGIITARDDFAISFEKTSLESRINTLRSKHESDDFVKQAFNLQDKPTFHWFLSEAREKLRDLSFSDYEECFTKILYRPFDERFIFYNSAVIERTRENVMKHMSKENISLSLTKRHPAESAYNDVFVSDKITEGHLLSGALGITYTFPLYVYKPRFYAPEKPKTKFPAGMMMLFDAPNEQEKQPNIKAEIIEKLSTAYKKKIEPEDIFYYIYGVLYSNVYRKKYNEFLKIDFPKIPFTNNAKTFFAVGKLGKDLADLHLLKLTKSQKLLSKFPVSTGSVLTDGLVKKREYNEKEKRIYINDQQYFDNITEQIWNYYIGGYQVLDKWLKDRIGNKLLPCDINHYLEIITALKNTIVLQEKIDKLYLEIEKNLIIFDNANKGTGK